MNFSLIIHVHYQLRPECLASFWKIFSSEAAHTLEKYAEGFMVRFLDYFELRMIIDAYYHFLLWLIYILVPHYKYPKESKKILYIPEILNLRDTNEKTVF